jgi:glycosyltransferase involved in cell wall biosynthesis
VYAGNPDSLSWGITKVLTDGGFANRLRANAHRKVQEKYNWDMIAQQTKKVYEAVLNEYSKSFWAQKN